MKKWDTSHIEARQQSKAVVHSVQLVGSQVNPRMLESYPIIQNENMPFTKCRDMTDDIDHNSVQYYNPYEMKGRPNPEVSKGFRARFMDFYDKDITQTVVSIVIVLNAILYIIQTSV